MKKVITKLEEDKFITDTLSHGDSKYMVSSTSGSGSLVIVCVTKFLNDPRVRLAVVIQTFASFN